MRDYNTSAHVYMYMCMYIIYVYHLSSICPFYLLLVWLMRLIYYFIPCTRVCTV